MTSLSSCESESFPVSQSFLYDHMEQVFSSRKNGRNALTSYATKKYHARVGASCLNGTDILEKDMEGMKDMKGKKERKGMKSMKSMKGRRNTMMTHHV